MPTEEPMPVQELPTDRPGIELAARYLRAGELVAFPTETVYGLGADATDEAAVEAVFAAKGRPRTDPLIVHVDGVAMAAALGNLDVGTGFARRLAEAFWPGPLTVVVPKADPDPWRLAAGVSMNHTVALRCPAHPVALDLISEVGAPVAAPSANRFGRVSPTTAAHVLAELQGRIRAVIDAGPSPLGVESTVLAFGPDAKRIEGSVRVLRPGGVPFEDIDDALPEGVLAEHVALTVSHDGPAASPGTASSHYVPEVPLVFAAGAPGLAAELASALRGRGLEIIEIDLPEPREAARRLYGLLRSLGERSRGATSGPDAAIVAALEPQGLGRAVNDRLFRAAHARVRTDADDATIESILVDIGRFRA